MRKLGALCLVLALLAAAAWAFDEGELNLVSFKNTTSGTLEFIFLSPGDSDYWGPEILGSERVLESGQALGFYLHYPHECDTFDVMAVSEEGDTYVLYDHRICDGSAAVVEISDKDLTEDPPEMDFVTISIKNGTLPVYYVFISPEDSAYWGVDYLDEDSTLDMDGSASYLFPASDKTATYVVMAVDEEGDEYRFKFDIDKGSEGLTFTIEVADLYVPD
jgi:hypothetical protein